VKARYLVALVVCGVVAYRYFREGAEENGVKQVDLNAHVCTAKKPRDVEMALAEKGLTVTIDDRVSDAAVVEVPEDQKETALSALQILNVQHPEWGIKIRTDRFPTPKKR